MNAPDPAIIAAIDAQFRAVDLIMGGDNMNSMLLCKPHKLDVCAECGTDFFLTNQTARVFSALPKEIPVPPPPNVVHPQRSPLVQKAKEEGNVRPPQSSEPVQNLTPWVCMKQLFKKNKHPEAIQKYDMAAQIAATRFPWEASALVRDELAIVLCNRSAAFFAAGDPLAALVDADAVIQLKRPWSKGHFRKAKALVALGVLEDARESAELGLQFEPDSKVSWARPFPLLPSEP